MWDEVKGCPLVGVSLTSGWLAWLLVLLGLSGAVLLLARRERWWWLFVVPLVMVVAAVAAADHRPAGVGLGCHLVTAGVQTGTVGDGVDPDRDGNACGWKGQGQPS